jgi:hypothetical protein
VVTVTAVESSADRTHRVASGESASSIAARYYDDYELADLLLGYNGRSGTVIRVGESLKIPVCDEHVVRSGDSGSALSQRYLGRADRWPAVAVLNGLQPEAPLRVGQRLVFPVVLDHTLRPGETLAVLAVRFYGDAKRSGVLQQFNVIDDPRRLSVGQAVKVPLVAFRATVRPAPRPEPTVEHEPVPEVPAPPPARRFADALGEVASTLAHGEYDRADERLAALTGEITSEGSTEDRVELWRLVALAAVARDDVDRACRAYRELIEVQADWAPDPDLCSPKVRSALAGCL